MIILEYRPNYFESDIPLRTEVITSLANLKDIVWLNKGGHGWRVDGHFIRQADSDLIIAMIYKMEDSNA
jgi:hypothetical protein